MTQHLMLDIETFGTSPQGAIASIGAIIFNPFGDLMNNENEDIKQFYRNVSLQSSFDFGLVADGETIQWWMSQEKDATKALFDPKPINLSQALQEFMDFTQEQGHIARWWSHGENFDFPILESAYRAVPPPPTIRPNLVLHANAR